MSASGAELRRPGIVLCLAVLLAARFSHSAPVYDQETTQVAEYSGGGSTCYYNYKHYQEGDRIITNEPCLNCTCHDRMLMCYLRVCPFTKAIGQDCTVEKRPDQCCPVITCPQVPVQLLTSTTSSPSSESTELGFRDSYGCNVNNLFYADGAQLPIDYHNPCELCYCIRNRTTCLMQECTLKVAGCKPIFQPGVCCPVKYDCDYADRAETTLAPTTPGLLMTTTIAPGGATECYYGGKTYEDGELIYSTKPCQHCYCFGGEIACAIQDCGTPMKTHGKNCTALPPPEGECCPTTYQCESDFDNEVTSMPDTTEDVFGTSDEPISTLSPTEGESETEASIPDESYPGADNTIPELRPEDESTTTQEIDQEITVSSESPEKTTQPILSSEKPSTDVPEIEDNVTEEIEISTEKEEDTMTTLSAEEVSITTEKTSSTEDTSEPSTPPLPVTEKERKPEYTEKPEDVGTDFSTETSATEKSTEISSEMSTSGKGLEEPITSTEASEEVPKTDAPTTISIEDFTYTDKPRESVDEESKTTVSENEVPQQTDETSTETGLTSSKSPEDGQLSEETTPSTYSTESSVHSTTKPDTEASTKIEKEEITTKQPVTIPISDRMPEHKAEDKDAISEMPMTELPTETEMTPGITVTYLPPVSTTVEEQEITSTESFVETTGLPKEPKSTNKPELPQTDSTTMKSEDIDHTPVSVPISTEREPEQEVTGTTVTVFETETDEMKTTHILPSTESSDAMLGSTPSVEVESTDEPSKTSELDSTTVTEPKLSEEETSPTPESYTTEIKPDVNVDVSKPLETTTVKETPLDSEEKLSTEMGADQTMSTESSEEKTEKPEITIPVTEKSTTTDMKAAEEITTEVLTTEVPKELSPELPPSSEGTLEEGISSESNILETSTPKLFDTETTMRVTEYSTQESAELPDRSTEKTETSQTDMDTSELTSSVSTETTMDEHLSTSTKSTDVSEEETSKVSLDDEIGVTHDMSEISSPETTTTSQGVETNAPELEDRIGETEKPSESPVEEEMKQVTTSQQEETPKPALEGETVMPHVPKKEESDVDMSHIPDIVTPEMTASTEVESSHTTQPTQTEGTPVPPEMRPPMGIPGEGNCLVDGQSYSNNSAIPPANTCQIRCRCISSIVQCDLVECLPPPSNQKDCIPIHTSSECCPTYNCAIEGMPGPESDNHMLDHETPSPDSETVTADVEKTTLKTIDEHSLLTSTQESTGAEDDKITVTEDLDKLTTIVKETSEPTIEVTESVVPSSTSTMKPDEYETSEVSDKSTESPELTTKMSTLDSEVTTPASDSMKEDDTKQTSIKPTDVYVTEELPLSTERQTEKPSDDELTEKTEKPTGGEEIPVSTESTVKPDTEEVSTEMDIRDETTEKLSTESPSSTEKQTEVTEEESTPVAQTTVQQSEEADTSTSTEHSISKEEPGSTMSTLFEVTSSPEFPKDEMTEPSSEQPDTERETTAVESYTKPAESKPLDSLPEETTSPSIQEPSSPSLPADVTSPVDESTTTQTSSSVEEKIPEIFTETETTQKPDEILDENIVTTEMSLDATPSSTEAGLEEGVSSTSVPDRSTEISMEVTGSTTVETNVYEETTSYTSEPTESSVGTTEKPAEKETKPIEEKTPEEEGTMTPADEQTSKPSSYPEEITTAISDIPVTSETPAQPEQETSTEHPQTEKEGPSITDEIYGTSSTEKLDLQKEGVTTVVPAEVAVTETVTPTIKITEESEVPQEPTTVSSDEMSSSSLPVSTEIPDVDTKITDTEETSSTEKESESQPSTSPEDEMLELTTSKEQLEGSLPTTSKEQLEGSLPTTSKEQLEGSLPTTSEPAQEVSSKIPTETKSPDELPVEPEVSISSTEIPEVPKTTLSPEKEEHDVSSMEPEDTDKSTSEPITKLPPISTESSSESSEELTPEEEIPSDEHLPGEGEDGSLEPEEHEFNHTMEADHSSTTAPDYSEPAPDMPENPSFPMNGGSYLNPDEDYDEDDQAIYGPGTCRYGGKVYMSAQQIPRDDPCDFCFCFRSDIICLQQSCPPPIPGCHEEPINGFCCPRYECHVSMAASLNLTTTTTTTTTTLPPHFLTHAYKGAAKRSGCIVGGQAYRVGDVIKSASGPCLQCTCGGDGNMNCNPRVCLPEPSYRQMIAHATAKRRR